MGHPERTAAEKAEFKRELTEVIQEFTSNHPAHFDKFLSRIPKHYYENVNPAILVAAGRDKWPLPVKGPYDPDFVARDLREAVIALLDAEGRPLPAHPGAPLSRDPS